MFVDQVLRKLVWCEDCRLDVEWFVGTGVVEEDALLQWTERGGGKLLRNVSTCIPVSTASYSRRQEVSGTDWCISHQLTVSLSCNIKFNCFWHLLCVRWRIQLVWIVRVGRFIRRIRDQCSSHRTTAHLLCAFPTLSITQALSHGCCYKRVMGDTRTRL